MDIPHAVAAGRCEVSLILRYKELVLVAFEVWLVLHCGFRGIHDIRVDLGKLIVRNKMMDTIESFKVGGRKIHTGSRHK